MNTRYNTYFYYRNGLLHIRHMVDEAVELSEYEAEKLKEKLTANPADKQQVLSDEWDFQVNVLHKKKVHGTRTAFKRTEEMTRRYKERGRRND